MLPTFRILTRMTRVSVPITRLISRSSITHGMRMSFSTTTEIPMTSEIATPDTTTSPTATTSTTSTTSKPKPTPPEKSKNVHISYQLLCQWIVQHLFKQFGQVETTSWVSKNDTLLIQVKFADTESARSAALHIHHRTIINGPPLRMVLAPDSEDKPRVGFDYNTYRNPNKKFIAVIIPIRELLLEYLKPYGVQSVASMYKLNCAFAKFDTEENAALAIKSLRNQRFPMKNIQVEGAVVKEIIKQERQQQQQKEQQQQNDNIKKKVAPPPPSLWNITIDPATNRPYYWHEFSGEVTWERPAELGPE